MNQTNDPQVRAARIAARGGIVTAIITAILAPIIIYAFTHNPTPTDRAPTPAATVTPSGDNSTAAPSQTSVTPPKTVTVNRQLMCVSDCNTDDPIASHSINVQITVISFTFETAQEQTSMLVLLEPRSNESGCRFGLGDGLIMQDTTGKTYQPGGQLEGGGSFSLVQGQQQRLVATYAFIPSAGSTYTLHPSAINCDHHSIGYTPTYGDTPFTF